MRFTITIKDDAGNPVATVTETDIANSIKRLGRDAQTGLRQIEFVINRVLDQREDDKNTDRAA